MLTCRKNLVVLVKFFMQGVSTTCVCYNDVFAQVMGERKYILVEAGDIYNFSSIQMNASKTSVGFRRLL